MTHPLVDARRALPWLLVLLVVVAFAFQGTRGIWEPDEGRYSSAGINMHESGDWLVPTVDGVHPHLTKPPMVYWALATSFALFGHDEWAARLPSALAFIGTGLLVFGLGCRLCPARPWLPAFIWATSFAPAIASNIVSTDPVLAVFETAAMYAFVEAWSREGPGARRCYVLMWLAWGLAFLTKGPPGLLALVGMTAFLALHDRARLRQMMVPAGLAAFVVVAFTWFGVIIAQQPDRLGYFLGYEIYGRVFTAVHDRNSQWWGGIEVYVPMLLFGTLPWSVLAIVAAGGPRAAWRKVRHGLRERRADWRLLGYWLLVPLVVFFLARSRLQLYVLPLFAPLALVMGRALADSPAMTDRKLARTVGVAAAVMVALKGTFAYWPSDRDARDLAVHFERMVNPHDVGEIVFVNMRPFYGLNVYLDLRIDGVEIDRDRFEYSKVIGRDQVCAELAGRDRPVYALKERRAPAFVTAVVHCGKAPRLLGKVFANGAYVRLYLIPTEPRRGVSG